MGKIAVFGLLKQNGNVYTVVVPNAQSATLLPIIREKVKPNSIRIPFVVMMCLMSVNLAIFASITARILLKINHINGIENFWNQAKRHLRKFNDIPKEYFERYLKECEWRFNNSEIKSQISILKQ